MKTMRTGLKTMRYAPVMRLYTLINIKHHLLLILCVFASFNSKTEMTQTEAHLSIPSINALVQKKYNFKENPFYKKIYDQVVAKERQHNKTHDVFYNAFSNEWLLPQDLYLKLFSKLHPLTIDIKSFRTFRWISVDHITPKALLKRELTSNGMVDDNKLHIKANLLSTNLALFGNVGYSGECTFEFFLHAKSHRTIDADIFKSILDIFDKPTSYEKGETPILYKYIPEIQKLTTYLEPIPLKDGKKPQSLAQIFIPKKITDNVAYLSWVRGMPFDASLVSWLKNDPNLNTPMPSFKSFQPRFVEIQNLFKDKDSNHPLFKEILKGIEEGKYGMSKLLHTYKTKPATIPGLNFLQARLIISPEYIGNPSMEIKTFDYNNISEKNKKTYEKKLDELVNKMFRDVLNRAASITKKIA